MRGQGCSGAPASVRKTLGAHGGEGKSKAFGGRWGLVEEGGQVLSSPLPWGRWSRAGNAELSPGFSPRLSALELDTCDECARLGGLPPEVTREPSACHLPRRYQVNKGQAAASSGPQPH